jgi:hypothetical protein
MKFMLFVLALAGIAVMRRAPQNPVRSDAEWNDLCVTRQSEAYHLGLQQGQSVGEIRGQSNAFAAIEQQVKARGEMFGEITSEDVERARKGMLH